ncbi:MAG: DUF4143 domain-containing protein [Bacteroidetes bacterium]|nr:MAG: DUF4143 domain-containing protein [Bacteroidota bacterium]
MEFKRKAYQKLLDWKNRPSRKPLVIRGARQVGKSTLVHQFSKEFAHFIPLNLEKSLHQQWFGQLSDVHQITEAIFLNTNTPQDGRPVLIFLDEIQESPRAIQMLRYFYEEKPELYIIAAGSLLEFALKEVPSFPVGRVEQMVLHPFDFEEFLMALGHDAALRQLHTLPIPAFAHSTMMELFHTYALIGGMPEIVKLYVQEKHFSALKPVYESLWQGYQDDVEKYAGNATEKKVIRHVIHTAAMEKDRIAFEGFGNSAYKSREVGEALRALGLARIIQLIYPSNNVQPPILADLKKRPRLQFVDTGLLNYAMNVQAQMIGIADLNDFYKGKIIQHLITQELQAQFDTPSYKPHFWTREKSGSSAEVDILYAHDQYLIPVEVKSGSQGKLRSLHQFMESCGHPYAVRLLGSQFSVDSLVTPGGKPYHLMNLPYYLGTKIPRYLSFFTEQYPHTE